MASNVPAPIPRVSRFGLIHSVGGEAGVSQFMKENPSEKGSTRWEDGFDYTPESCMGTGAALDPCAPAGFVPAALDGPRDEFFPYLIHEELKCSTIGNDAVGLVDRTKRLLLRSTSRQVERELMFGLQAQAAGWDNPYLTDSNLTMVSDDPVPFLDALAYLQQALVTCMDGGRGMIHTTHRLASKWFSFGAVYVENGMMLDGFGNIIVAGAGYFTEFGATELAIATGEVSVRLSEVQVVNEENTRIDATNNVDSVVATRVAAATWDCCQLGVTADICTANCTAVG